MYNVQRVGGEDACNVLESPTGRPSSVPPQISIRETINCCTSNPPVVPSTSKIPSLSTRVGGSILRSSDLDHLDVPPVAVFFLVDSNDGDDHGTNRKEKRFSLLSKRVLPVPLERLAD